MRLRVFLVSVGVGLFSTAIMAQSPSDPLAALGLKVVQPLSPDATQAMRQKVDGLLAAAGATAWFTNITDAGGGSVRHNASGLVCPLGADGQRIVAASASEALCETRDGDSLFRSHVVPGPAATTLDAVAAEALAQVRREPGYAPVPGPMMTGHPQPGSQRPDHRTLRFTSRVDGRPRLSHLRIGIVRQWILTDRQEDGNPQEETGMRNMLAEASFGSNMGVP